MKIKNKLKSYYSNFKINDNLLLTILFGGSLISLIIWNRLLRNRLPRDLVPVHWGFLTLVIGLLMTLYISLFLYYLLKWYKIIPRENSRFSQYLEKVDHYIKNASVLNKIVSTIQLIVEQHLIYGPHRLYDKIYKKNVMIAFCMDKFTDFVGFNLNKYLWVLPKDQLALVLFFCIIYALPRVLPTIVFVVEVILWQHLHYFYKGLFLLIIPLLSDVVLFFLRNNVENRMNYILNFYNIENKINGKEYTMIMQKKNINSNEYNVLVNLYKTEELIATKWIDYMAIYNITNQIQIQIEHFKYKLKISCYALLAVGFLVYFMILRGLYDGSILSSLQIVLFLELSLFQIITVSLLLCCIIFSFFIKKALKAFYEYLYLYIIIKGFYDYISKILINLIEIYPKYLLLYYVLLFYIPFIIPFVILIIETLYCNDLYYCYISLYDLVIPQIIYVIDHHTRNTLDYLAKLFFIEQDLNTNIIHITYKHLEDPEDIENAKEFDPQTAIQSWLYFTKMHSIYNALELRLCNYYKILWYSTVILGFISLICLIYFKSS